MGLVHTTVILRNPREPDLAPITQSALVDTGAATLCIPQHVALQLRLETMEEREVTTADGKKSLVPYVGPIRLTFENRNCFVGALVLGDEILLGAIPMEDMDLVVVPSRQTVSVNPLSPNIPSMMVKNTKVER